MVHEAVVARSARQPVLHDVGDDPADRGSVEPLLRVADAVAERELLGLLGVVEAVDPAGPFAGVPADGMLSRVVAAFRFRERHRVRGVPAPRDVGVALWGDAYEQVRGRDREVVVVRLGVRPSPRVLRDVRPVVPLLWAALPGRV
eukprot:scaffold47805_cov51-Phaeocystis_antarctica.AAC.1